MDRNGSAYTFIFATIVTTVAAILLGSAATALKPLQDLNADVDKKSKTLFALGLYEDNMKAEAVQAFFTAEGNEGRIVKKFAVSHDGDVVEISDEKKIADLTLYSSKETFLKLIENIQSTLTSNLKSDVAANKPSQYVVPIFGYGLWSNCFGVIALDSEGKTINNLVYYAHGETPV